MPADAEFNNPKPPNDEEIHRKRQMERIDNALRILGEHFSGVVILAHEQLPSGMVDRYSRMCGNELANRYQALRWFQLEEILETNRIMSFYINKQKPPEDENPYK